MLRRNAHLIGGLLGLYGSWHIVWTLRCPRMSVLLVSVFQDSDQSTTYDKLQLAARQNRPSVNCKEVSLAAIVPHEYRDQVRSGALLAYVMAKRDSGS